MNNSNKYLLTSLVISFFSNFYLNAMEQRKTHLITTDQGEGFRIEEEVDDQAMPDAHPSVPKSSSSSSQVNSSATTTNVSATTTASNSPSTTTNSNNTSSKNSTQPNFDDGIYNQVEMNDANSSTTKSSSSTFQTSSSATTANAPKTTTLGSSSSSPSSSSSSPNLLTNSDDNDDVDDKNTSTSKSSSSSSSSSATTTLGASLSSDSATNSEEAHDKKGKRGNGGTGGNKRRKTEKDENPSSTSSSSASNTTTNNSNNSSQQSSTSTGPSFLSRAYSKFKSYFTSSNSPSSSSTTTNISTTTPASSNSANNFTTTTTTSSNNNIDNDDVETGETHSNAGLINLGNTCFMNSVLQALVNIKPLNDALKKSTQPNGELLNAFIDLKNSILQNNQKSIAPKEFMAAAHKAGINTISANITTSNHEQQDASEFLIQFLDKILPASNNVIKNIFGFSIRSTLTAQDDCPVCGRKKNLPSISLDSAKTLELSIDQSTHNLSDALEKYNRVENLTDYHCEDCAQKLLEAEIAKIQQTNPTLSREFILTNAVLRKQIDDAKAKAPALKATKLLQISETHQILTIVLKRSNLLQDKISFPTNNLDISTSTALSTNVTKYNLIGFICHIGNSLKGGHYVSYIRNNGQWYLCNDDSVAEVTVDQIDEAVKNNNKPYILFYQNQQTYQGDTNQRTIGQGQDNAKGEKFQKTGDDFFDDFAQEAQSASASQTFASSSTSASSTATSTPNKEEDLNKMEPKKRFAFLYGKLLGASIFIEKLISEMTKQANFSFVEFSDFRELEEWQKLKNSYEKNKVSIDIDNGFVQPYLNLKLFKIILSGFCKSSRNFLHSNFLIFEPIVLESINQQLKSIVSKLGQDNLMQFIYAKLNIQLPEEKQLSEILLPSLAAAKELIVSIDELIEKIKLAHSNKKAALKKLCSGEKNLSYADLSEVDLSDKDLSGVNFEGANLSKAILKNTKLNNANLRNADLSGATLDCAELKKANLTKTNFSGATLQRVSLNEIILDKTNFRGTTFIDIVFSGLQFTNLDFSDAQFKDVTFVECEILRVCMDRIQAGNITFEKSSLSHVTFRKAILYGLEMKEMHCFGYKLDFEEAHIISSEFKGQSSWANPETVTRVFANVVRFWDEKISAFTGFFDRSWGAASFFVQTNFKQTRLTNVKFNFTIFAMTSGWDEIILKKVEFCKVHFGPESFVGNKWGYALSLKKYHWGIVEKMKTKGAVVNGQCNTEYESDWQENYVLDDEILPTFLKGCISELGTKFIKTDTCSIQ